MKIKITESQRSRLIEIIENENVICDKCGWTWALSDGGDDPYICHKCWNDNQPKKEEDGIS